MARQRVTRGSIERVLAPSPRDVVPICVDPVAVRSARSLHLRVTGRPPRKPPRQLHAPRHRRSVRSGASYPSAGQSRNPKLGQPADFNADKTCAAITSFMPSLVLPRVAQRNNVTSPRSQHKDWCQNACHLSIFFRLLDQSFHLGRRGSIMNFAVRPQNLTLFEGQRSRRHGDTGRRKNQN